MNGTRSKLEQNLARAILLLLLVRRNATKRWNELATDRTKLAEVVSHTFQPVGAWLIKTGMKLGSGLVALLLSVMITFVLLRNGAGIGATLVSVAARIGGEHGAWLLKLAGATVRGVVYGIIGTGPGL